MTETTPESAASPEPYILTWDDIQQVESADGAETVYLPAWGGSVRLRPITVKEVTRIEELCTNRQGERDDTKAKVLTIQAALVAPELTFPQVAQIVTDGKRATALAQLWDGINRVNSFGGEAVALASKSAGVQPSA
jgi:hypothetical protein